MSYALKIKRDDILKNVEDCTPKELAFDSTKPCAKVLQPGKYEFTIGNGVGTTYTIGLSSVLAFPLLILVFLYDPSDSSYKALGSETVLGHTQDYRGRFNFDSSNLYVYVENYTGSSVSTHVLYFICYA